jgi:NADH-quinone oxidoreductase subunit I
LFDRLKRLIRTITLIDLIKGLALTGSVWVRSIITPKQVLVTRPYPEVKRPAFPAFKGHHAFLKDEDGSLKCVGCGICAGVCPSKAIKVSTEEGENHEKLVTGYEIDAFRCIYCGNCQEACPKDAIILTQLYEMADYDNRELYIWNMERLLEAGDKRPIFRDDVSF